MFNEKLHDASQETGNLQDMHIIVQTYLEMLLHSTSHVSNYCS